MKRFFGILFFLTLTTAAIAQQKSLVQFSGIIYNLENEKEVVPNVNITNSTYHNQANTANYKGYFSFVAHERDTLYFTSVGYVPLTIVIPAGVKNNSYTLVVKMKPQLINLPLVRVFPWATTEEFTKDFLNIKLADDDLALAYKNLNKNVLSAARATTARDPDEIRSADVQDLHNRIQNSHSLIPNPLLNPIAWGTLIKQIADGDKSRKSDN